MHTPSNRIRPCGELMPPGLFGSTTIDCSAGMEKANTRGATGATGVVVALVSISKMGSSLRHRMSRTGQTRSFDDVCSIRMTPEIGGRADIDGCLKSATSGSRGVRNPGLTPSEVSIPSPKFVIMPGSHGDNRT